MAIIFVLIIPNANERETRHQSLNSDSKATIQASTTHQQQKESQIVCVFLFRCAPSGLGTNKGAAHCPGAKRVAAAVGVTKNNFVYPHAEEAAAFYARV